MSRTERNWLIAAAILIAALVVFLVVMIFVIPNWDSDNDGIPDDKDNCPEVVNGEGSLLYKKQADIDGDRRGDVCDDDDDGDGVPDTIDNCPRTSWLPRGSGQQLADQSNTDGDAAGNICDADDDNDGKRDDDDNCPNVANPDQADADKDGISDACDTQATDEEDKPPTR